MTVYTDARSKPGNRLNTGTDDRELFMVKFGEMVLEAWARATEYDDMTFIKTIQSGKADSFPIIGRAAAAQEHTPGEIILGGKIEHNDVQITLDPMLYNSAFIAEVDELMSDYTLQGAYSRQLAESIALTYDQRIAIMHILASRVTDAPYTGGPVPGYSYDTDMRTDGAAMETAYYAAKAFIKTQDIGGSLRGRLPWQQYLIAARFTGLEGGPVTTGSGDRAAGTIGDIAGIPTKAVNHLPSTNITTGNTKFRGDFTTTVGHIGTEMAVGTLKRRGLKLVMKEQDDRLGTLLIASQFTGHGILRPECSWELATAVRA